MKIDAKPQEVTYRIKYNSGEESDYILHGYITLNHNNYRPKFEWGVDTAEQTDVTGQRYKGVKFALAAAKRIIAANL